MTDIGAFAAPLLGHRPAGGLGRLLHLVAHPAYPCPVCDQDGPLEVYVPAVCWSCGHTRSLPPLVRNGMQDRHYKIGRQAA